MQQNIHVDMRHKAQHMYLPINTTKHNVLTWTTTTALCQFTNKKYTLFYTRQYIQLIIIQQADPPKIKVNKVTRTRQNTTNYIIIH